MGKGNIRSCYEVTMSRMSCPGAKPPSRPLSYVPSTPAPSFRPAAFRATHPPILLFSSPDPLPHLIGTGSRKIRTLVRSLYQFLHIHPWNRGGRRRAGESMMVTRWFIENIHLRKKHETAELEHQGENGVEEVSHERGELLWEGDNEHNVDQQDHGGEEIQERDDLKLRLVRILSIGMKITAPPRLMLSAPTVS